MKNRLEVPDSSDIFAMEQEEFNTEIEIPEIDMYNQKIKPLFEGTKVYKRFSEKAVKTEYEEYDPIKNKGILPEAYDYCLRKLYVNINERQFEFFTLEGLPKKEAILPFNQIIGMRYSDNAKKIIKLKESSPQTGTKTDFIGTDNIPFSIMTKKNNWDIVCPEYTSYVAIKTMVDSILTEPKQKPQIEIERISSGDNEVNVEDYQKVKEQTIKLKAQKAKLEKQENIPYYIDNLKKLNSQLKNIDKKKEKAFEQFTLFFQQVQEEQLKLQKQSHQLKIQLLEFKEAEDVNAFGSKVKKNNNTEETNNNNAVEEEEKNNSVGNDESEDSEEKNK